MTIFALILSLPSGLGYALDIDLTAEECAAQLVYLHPLESELGVTFWCDPLEDE